MFDAQIQHIRAPRFPQLRFEWHPIKRKVYVIHITGEQEHGVVVADAVEDKGQAHMSVLIWLRGYQLGSAISLGQATPAA